MRYSVALKKDNSLYYINLEKGEENQKAEQCLACSFKSMIILEQQIYSC